MGDPGMRVRRLAAGSALAWTKVGDGQVFVADVVDQGSEPAAQTTVGFARIAKGEALDMAFPYDEVLILTKGAYTVRPEDGGEAVSARAGEVIYLPAGSANALYAEEDTEMVYVAAPPSVYADHVAATAGEATAVDGDGAEG